MVIVDISGRSGRNESVFFSPCLRDAIKMLGWSISEDEDPAAAILVLRRNLAACVLSQAMRRAREPPTIVYPILGSYRACSKCCLTRCLRWVQRVVPKLRTPETWLLPREMEAFLAACDGDDGYFIVKPSDGCKGQGIVLRRGCGEALSAWNEQDTPGPAVVQRYLRNPMLLDGRKFDVRVFVLVTAVCPKPTAFVFREGLVRMCSKPYSDPTPENATTSSIHLTNTAVNGAGQGDNSCKRCLSDFLNTDDRMNAEEFWQEADRIAAAVVIAMAPSLALEQHRSALADVAARQEDGGAGVGGAFQIFGLDLILDATGLMYFLEVNSCPSFELSTPLDCSIKVPVLAGALRSSVGELAPQLAVRDLGVGGGALSPMPLIHTAAKSQLARALDLLVRARRCFHALCLGRAAVALAEIANSSKDYPPDPTRLAGRWKLPHIKAVGTLGKAKVFRALHDAMKTKLSNDTDEAIHRLFVGSLREAVQRRTQKRKIRSADLTLEVFIDGIWGSAGLLTPLSVTGEGVLRFSQSVEVLLKAVENEIGIVLRSLLDEGDEKACCG